MSVEKMLGKNVILMILFELEDWNAILKVPFTKSVRSMIYRIMHPKCDTIQSLNTHFLTCNWRENALRAVKNQNLKYIEYLVNSIMNYPTNHMTSKQAACFCYRVQILSHVLARCGHAYDFSPLYCRVKLEYPYKVFFFNEKAYAAKKKSPSFMCGFKGTVIRGDYDNLNAT